jgi:hypothetical protein
MYVKLLLVYVCYLFVLTVIAFYDANFWTISQIFYVSHFFHADSVTTLSVLALHFSQ